MIGLIPAAGTASRIHGLPKYLLPVGDSYLLKILIDRMSIFGEYTVWVVANPANRSNIDVYCAGAYPHTAETWDTMTQTVLSARSIALESNVLFGMPDTYFEDANAFTKLAAALDNGADVAVGLFWARPEQRQHVGMCGVEAHNAIAPNLKVVSVIDKSQTTDMFHLWGCLAWTPTFWQFLKPEYLHVGYALQPAIDAGLDVRGVLMDGQYWDCGTPQSYFDCVTYTHAQHKSLEMETF